VVEQRRVLRTEIPGPRSRELHARREREVPAGFGDVLRIQLGVDRVAAVVAEPIMGEGGFVVPAPGFLPRVAAFCAENGIVFAADEVQTGLARTGAMFASEHEGLVPDLVCTAKALGGGLPLAGVTGRAEIMDAVHPGGLGGTYAGNPVACAAALGVLRAIEERDLVARAADIGALALPRLRALAAEVPAVGDVRGRGAMLALEFVEPGTTTPAPAVAAAVARRCHQQGVLVLRCGTYDNVLRLLPPLVIGIDLLDEALDVLAGAVRTVAG
jgi:4-aminobutyrate aminotransferase / (S)-3-amino-2-methylpropionate transaminase / 5-aminovalerate transaminase